MKAIINSGSYSWSAEILDTPTGRLIWDSLPIKGRANRWGEEIYFSIPVEAELESEASEVVPKGSLGYWPIGKAFCIFFGSTPASVGEEIRAASPVNLFGRVEGDLRELDKVQHGDLVVIEKRL